MKLSTRAFLVAAVASLSNIASASAANAVPAAIEAPVLNAAQFPAAWTVKTLINSNSMDLGDGSVGMLGAVKLPSNKLFDTASPAAAATAQARDYFRTVLGGKSANNGVELTTTGSSDENGEVTTYMVQTVNGVRIAGTYAMASIRNNTLTYARHFLVQAPAIDTTPFVAVQDAQAVALDAMRADAVNALLVEDTQPELQIVFSQGQAKLAWTVTVNTEHPWQKRAVYVDAQTGDFLSFEKLSHDDVSGHVNFKVEMDCVGMEQQEVPVPFVKWNGSDYTDSEGAFQSTKNIAASRVSLESPYFRIINRQGRVAGPWSSPLVAGADNDVLVTDRALDQLDPFYHLHHVRNWVRNNVVGSNNQTAWTNKQIQVKVNINDTCNAYYDGTLNFFAAGDGCLNTARTSGIVYHEYGHGIHDHSPAANSGLRMDSQVSEGVGDYVAATLTDNPNIHGIYSCHDNFRKLTNRLTYCSSGCDLSPRSEVHNAGQVISAVWWEIRGLLAKRYGKDQGVKTSDRLFLKFLTKVGNMTSAYQAAIAADDDTDNDPTNGTVHSCEINRAFANDTPGSRAHFPLLKGHLVPCEAHSQ